MAPTNRPQRPAPGPGETTERDWIAATCLQMVGLAVDYVRPDGELSEPALRLIALVGADLAAGRKTRDEALEDWGELPWLLLSAAAGEKALLVGLLRTGWGPEELRSPKAPVSELEVLAGLARRADAIVAQRVEDQEVSDPSYERAGGVISDSFMYLDACAQRYPGEFLRLDGNLSAATARLLAYYSGDIAQGHRSRAEVQEHFDLALFEDLFVECGYASGELVAWSDIAFRGGGNPLDLDTWLERVAEPGEGIDPRPSAACVRFCRLLGSELEDYLDSLSG